ncbi:MAG: HAD-IIIA family hydrolase [bacterium]|nr:HAD-IIIA family hydrolase [bacterium]
MAYRAVLFDFDYTLGDSTNGIVACMDFAFEKMGCKKKSEDAIKKTIGHRLQDAYVQLEQDENKEKQELFKKYYLEKADQVMTDSAILYEGVIDMLKELKTKGMKLGVITTKQRYRVLDILKKFNIKQYFDVTIGGDSVHKEKPDPEGIRLAMSMLKMEKEDILYVGDSLVDASTAKRAGVDFIAVLTGTTTKDEFIKYPYKQIIKDVSRMVV